MRIRNRWYPFNFTGYLQSLEVLNVITFHEVYIKPDKNEPYLRYPHDRPLYLSIQRVCFYVFMWLAIPLSEI